MDSNTFITFILPVIFLTVGGIFFTIGLFVYKRYKIDKEKASRTTVVQGEIINHKERWSCDTDGHGHTMYAPVIKYEWNGFMQEHISSVSYGKPKPPGSLVNVNILPNGEVIDVDGVKILKIIGIIFTIVGIVALCVGIGVGVLMLALNGNLNF